MIEANEISSIAKVEQREEQYFHDQADNVLYYSALSTLWDGFSALYPLIGGVRTFLEATHFLFNAEFKGVALGEARQKFVNQVEGLSEQQVEKREAFFKMVEELYQEIPEGNRPFISLTTPAVSTAHYNFASNTISVSEEDVDTLDTNVMKFAVARELFHSLNHSERDEWINKGAQSLSVTGLGIVGNLLGISVFSVLAAVVVGSVADAVIRNARYTNEFAADKYAVEMTKSAAGAKQFFVYEMEKYSKEYRKCLDEGFTEEQAFRLGSARAAFLPWIPSYLDRLNEAQKVEASLQEREVEWTQHKIAV